LCHTSQPASPPSQPLTAGCLAIVFHSCGFNPALRDPGSNRMVPEVLEALSALDGAPKGPPGGKPCTIAVDVESWDGRIKTGLSNIRPRGHSKPQILLALHAAASAAVTRPHELTLAPGGHVGEHNHEGPGIRQVTSGYLTTSCQIRLCTHHRALMVPWQRRRDRRRRSKPRRLRASTSSRAGRSSKHAATDSAIGGRQSKMRSGKTTPLIDHLGLAFFVW
jgi:hypothetical protein